MTLKDWDIWWGGFIAGIFIAIMIVIFSVITEHRLHPDEASTCVDESGHYERACPEPETE